MMVGISGGKPAQPGAVEFHPLSEIELAKGNHVGVTLHHFGIGPKHKNYTCGVCGGTTNGRVLCDVQRVSDGARVSWCWCSCERGKPTILVEKDGMTLSHFPIAKEFHAKPNWPPDLAKLYEEAAKSFSAGAFTACAMVCRKLLMATACHEGEQDGKSFVEYVGFITTSVLAFPKAQLAIDRIRTIGNDANHNVQFVSEDDAKRAMEIVTYLLATIYSLPSA